MKKKLILLFILCISFFIFIGVKFFLDSRKEEGGIIKIVSSPTAAVFIDSVALGKTPYENKIKTGEHIIKLIPEKTASNTASWQGKVQISSGTLAYIDRELGETELSSGGIVFSVSKSTEADSKNMGELFVESEPDGSIVYLNNDEKGITPLALSNIQAGNHELSVYNPGFIRRTQKINIEQGYRLNAHFKLAIDPSFKKITEDDIAQATISATITSTISPTAAQENTAKITVRKTPTGWLRVRSEPTINASESGKINPGETYAVFDEKDGWYQIEFAKGKRGWVSGQYVEKQ